MKSHATLYGDDAGDWFGKPAVLYEKWHVFPMNVSGRWSYERAENHDGRRWGMTAEADEVREYWSKHSDAGIGIATGAESGVFVVETDTVAGGHAADGLAALSALEEGHGALPPTLEAESPSGSIHRYYNHPGIDIKNSAGVIGPGIDVRGDRGMVIAPPSVKPGKGVYKWRNDNAIADAPQWLIDRCRRSKAQATDGQKRYAQTVLKNRCAELSALARNTCRNDTLNTTALLLAKLVAANALTREEVRSGLINA